ncbi:deoxyguanosinetriphosphate triphosphohydrolase [bacterium]|nr:MAG: deoxyguanosinetriphosphate triphosphohydrolase [bacterium]
MSDSIRERLEDEEEIKLHPRAARSRNSAGRDRPEEPCPIRLAYQVDRDRILHSKSFRRLSQKTQVFLAPAGDHYRTRLTHTLEVSQIARTISRAMGLNENLTEAVALAHDLGHTPFGHAGENVLNELSPKGFHHATQSLRVVEILERGGAGLNLTREVRDGIVGHSKGKGKIMGNLTTLEASVVRVADLIAYLNHDLDDALRAGVVSLHDVPERVVKNLGSTHGSRISAIVSDVIGQSLAINLENIEISPQMNDILVEFRAFLYDRVYDNPQVHGDFIKAIKVMRELYEYYRQSPENLPDDAKYDAPPEVRITDFIAGMTDRFALTLYESIFMPKPWKVL